MNFRSNPLASAPIHADGPTALARLACGLSLCGILSACSPSPDTTPTPRAAEPVPRTPPASVVSIPEEFLSSPPSPQPMPNVLPRVVFATSDFQVTTRHGIQGIRAGEALNFLREEKGDYVVESGGREFQKNKSYFAATYVGPSRPGPTPFAGESTPAARRASPESPVSDETSLGGLVTADDPASVTGQKKLGALTDAIRALNDQIRSAQDELAQKSARSSGGEEAPDIRKTQRAIQKLKEKRDALSGQLTEIGKP